MQPCVFDLFYLVYLWFDLKFSTNTIIKFSFVTRNLWILKVTANVNVSSPLLSSRWSSDGQYCRVVKDSGNYVECACSHLSIYTAYAEVATLASYNEAFYASGFICISGTTHVHPSTSPEVVVIESARPFILIWSSYWLCVASSSGFALAVMSHVLCSRFPMFAAKLLIHMMLSCLGTQVRHFSLKLYTALIIHGCKGAGEHQQKCFTEQLMSNMHLRL